VPFQTPTIIGKSRAFCEVQRSAERAARAPVTILLTGEMGTGKDVLANYIHAKSGRRGPIIALNCAGIPDALLEAELFGHERGAFTGATQSRAGLVTAAHGGTLFLDEIGDMPFALQAKILRFLQDGAVRRVGQTDERKVDVRVIAATNRELDRMAGEGTFRPDLLFRLDQYRIELPPLRERRDDIVLLARAFLHRNHPGKRLSREAQRALVHSTYGWPGNVRELENVLRRAAVDAGRTIRPEQIPARIREATGQRTDGDLFERIDALLSEREPRSASELRRELGVARSTLHRALVAAVARGAVAARGDGRARRYSVQAADPGVPAVNDRARRALDHVRAHGRITRGEYATVTGCSERTASRDLDALCAEGLLARDGQPGRTAGYRSQ
jgi:transcriptional regulator with GAF, ATPase, and Fis domain